MHTSLELSQGDEEWLARTETCMDAAEEVIAERFSERTSASAALAEDKVSGEDLDQKEWSSQGDPEFSAYLKARGSTVPERTSTLDEQVARGFEDDESFDDTGLEMEHAGVPGETRRAASLMPRQNSRGVDPRTERLDLPTRNWRMRLEVLTHGGEVSGDAAPTSSRAKRHRRVTIVDAGDARRAVSVMDMTAADEVVCRGNGT